jgi:hypothetical protein
VLDKVIREADSGDLDIGEATVGEEFDNRAAKASGENPVLDRDVLSVKNLTLTGGWGGYYTLNRCLSLM